MQIEIYSIKGSASWFRIFSTSDMFYKGLCRNFCDILWRKQQLWTSTQEVIQRLNAIDSEYLERMYRVRL